MKTILLLFCVLLTFIQCECDDDTSRNPWKLGIDLQSDFSGERVQIFLDNDLVSHSHATTYHILDVTDVRLLIDVAEGLHVLKLIVADNAPYEEQIPVVRNTYLGIQYDPAGEAIAVQQSDTVIGYD